MKLRRFTKQIRQSASRNRSFLDRTTKRKLFFQSMERRELLAAETLQIAIENLSDDGGLAGTPFWVSAHDGSFNIGTVGQDAADFGGLELLAEEGDPTELAARFAAETGADDAVISAPMGFAGAPVFEPGETVVETLSVADSMQSRFFSFASMVIPSNDAFIANLNPTAIELFDTSGAFLGPRTIVVYGSDIYDAGTEVNDPTGGAAFSVGGGVSDDENGVIANHAGLDSFVGTGLPTGENLAKSFGPNTPIARITISRLGQPAQAIDSHGPRTQFHSTDINAQAGQHEIVVTYSDPSGIDLTSIGAEDIRIVGPLLTELEILSVQIDAPLGSSPHEVTATYVVAPSSGSFTSLDNGTYSVSLLGDEVNDPFGLAAPAQLLGNFSVDVPVRLNVSFENLSELGGLANTPVWFGVHEGTFEIGRAGSSASDFSGLEALAEEGDVSGIDNRFLVETAGVSEVLFAPSGFAGAPVFEPGESESTFIDIIDPTSQRFFSYASMVIPSNDAFFANLDPRSIELFDSSGNFSGARSFTIYGQDIWDAGTEENNAFAGAAFSTEGGTGTDENGFIKRHDGLEEFIGTGLPTGENLSSAFDSMSPIGRFTISLANLPASPIDLMGPSATLDASDLTTAGHSSHQVRVTYSDPSGIDVTSIDVDDLEIVGTFADSIEVVGVSTDAVAGQLNRTVTATYEVASVHGPEITTFDNGLYFANLKAGEINDVLGNGNVQASLGSFEILVPVQLEIMVENLAPEGGLSQTPFWIAVHEGNFQVAAAGQPASQFGGLESLAEGGDVAELSTRFAAESSGVDGVVFAPNGFAGAPILEPGESDTATLEVLHSNENRFFSFASMVIPSNDAFVANLNPRSFELFDENGFFTGQKTITIYGRDIWDAGTEVNDPNGGAAFTVVGGTDVDESGVIRRHEGLDDFVGSELPTGENLQAAFSSVTPIARLTISLAGSTTLPLDQAGPTAEVVASDVTDSGTSNHQIDVTYSDPSGIDLTSIDTDDIRISGPLDHRLVVTDFLIDPNAESGDSSVTVTYTVTSPSGEFNASDNGRYTIGIRENEVSDTLGQTAHQQPIGNFDVNVGVRIQIAIESLTESDGLFLTPFWVGLHDGGFEVARGGVDADQFSGLELIAEEGDASELAARFETQSEGTDTVLLAPGGFAGAPVLDPGELVTQVIEVKHSYLNRFFSFASMVIPSNDAFLANRNSRQFELFDSRGNFRGAKQITLHGRDILDAGTEVNDPNGGAAFSTEGGSGTDQDELIQVHAGLDDFIGTGLPTGEVLGSAFSGSTPIVRITISLFDPEADVCSGVMAACSVRSVTLQNAELSADVNRDGEVSPLDALLVINFLGRFGDTDTIAEEAQATGLSLDVEGDERISTIDALVVINEVGRLLASSSAEGEGVDRFDEAVVQLTSSGGLLSETGDSDLTLEIEFQGKLF